MTLTTFRLLIRALVPGAKTSVVKTDVLDLLINEGVRDVNVRVSAYLGNKTFNVTAEVQEYLMSAHIDDFVGFSEGGLYWNDGTAATVDWKRLTAMSRETLNTQYPQWLNNSSDSPLRYFRDNDSLMIDPKPNTTLASGFWAFYVKKPNDMTAGTHYPFTGTATEITALSVLDEAIIDYVRYKLAIPLEGMQKGMITLQEYEAKVSARADLLNKRLDITANPNLRMRGPYIG